MKSITFTFGQKATEKRQNELSRKLRGLPGVVNVGRISPNATAPGLRRLWYAEVADDATADVVNRLREHADVESADLPAERGLL